jgi:hypothetical protein
LLAFEISWRRLPALAPLGKEKMERGSASATASSGRGTQSWSGISMEGVTMALAENAGLDPLDIIVELRSTHEKGHKWYGVDPFEGKAVDMMWKQGISQMPIVDGDKVVGSIREETILNRFNEENPKDVLEKPIADLLEEPFPSVSIETNIDDVLRLLSIGASAVLVNDHQRMVGIITKIDLIANKMM